MKTLFLLSAALLVLPLSFSTSSEEPAKASSLPGIDKLIEQLGDREFKTREAASKAIQELGPDALPVLASAKKDVELEVRKRIEKLEEFLFTAPKRVTLNLKDRPLNEALEQLAKQTGYNLEWPKNDERAKKLHSFRLEKATFWEALDKIRSEGGLPTANAGDGKMTLSFDGHRKPFFFNDGPFRVTAQGFERLESKSNQFGEPTEKQVTLGQLKMTLGVFAELRFEGLQVLSFNVTEAIDDQKKSLVFDRKNTIIYRLSNDRMITGNFDARFYTWNFGTPSPEIYLSLPSKEAKKLASIKGTANVSLIKERKNAAITEKILEAKGKKFKVGNQTFEIQDFAETANKQFALKVAITSPLFENTQNKTSYFRLEDEKGVDYYYNQTDHQKVNDQTVEISLAWTPPNQTPAAGPPLKLSYVTTITTEHTVNFEFKDLPLP